MTTTKLIIDADPGIGDAVAIALALSDPKLDVVALTAVGGLVSGERSFCNLQTIVSLIDPSRWPRIGWSELPPVMSENTSLQTGLLQGHGREGLGDCEQIAAPPHQPTDSAKLLVDLADQHPGDVTLLTLGPLTNVQAAAERSKEFLSQLKQLVVCGGSVQVGGDVTAAAEFNIFANPHAADAILTSSAANITLAPLDTTQQFGLSFDEYDQLEVDAHTRLGRLLEALIPFALRANRTQLGREGVLLPEVVAVAAITHPELFERTPMTIDIELTGELTTGMTVFDRRHQPHGLHNIEVLTDVEPLAVKDYMLRLIHHREP